MSNKTHRLQTIGRVEWVSLPELGNKAVHAKVDSGAASSALHVSRLNISENRKSVSFTVFGTRSKRGFRVTHPIYTFRLVKSSNGQKARRPVIRTLIQIGSQSYKTDITLVNRDKMEFLMLLGCRAIRGRFLIDVASENLLGRK